MTDLAPAAQAVLDAFRAVPDLRDCPSIAAALRAAAQQFNPQRASQTEWEDGFLDGCQAARQFLVNLAAELENNA